MARVGAAATKVDPSAQMIEKRGAYVRALREQWPELTASAARFVVQRLDGGFAHRDEQRVPK